MVFLPWIYHFLMSVTGLFLDLICFFNWNIGHGIGLKTPFVLPSVFILANFHRLSRVTFLHKQLKYTSLRFDLSLKMYALFSNYCSILLDAILDYHAFGIRLKYNTKKSFLDSLKWLVYLIMNNNIYTPDRMASIRWITDGYTSPPCFFYTSLPSHK